MNSELVAKAREAKSAEELLSLAKENNIELTEDEAKEYYDRLHASGELSDDELDSVAGGGCDIVGHGNVCPNCGSRDYINTNDPYLNLNDKHKQTMSYYLQCKNCGTKYKH